MFYPNLNIETFFLTQNLYVGILYFKCLGSQFNVTLFYILRIAMLYLILRLIVGRLELYMQVYTFICILFEKLYFINVEF